MSKLSWKPKRRGDVYCSSACGYGCKWKDYKRQVAIGEKMRLAMAHPEQWHVRVEENNHWFVYLEHISTKAHLTVWTSLCGRAASYSALLSLSTPCAGDPEWQDNKSFSTPQAAVDHVVQRAKAIMGVKMAVLAKTLAAL